ncbi:SPOR domain-containing protein [Shewanella sp. Isolate11]|uniref:SPOR domain-containing protein n=1 Tax=Shewanella sp. Isolate11 TaxID=2908530 RepID=UPI001EFE9F6A|nr:SPOR domain-containing protein [Shewanella sp. Isolate11]MCG9696395.1 SPOR domain-containing protein [Shewanella sp. Isolate11]
MDEVEVKQKKVSSQFQNRLVGVIVIVALGVIFLPDILDGKKQHQEEQFAEIPLRPTQADSFAETPDIEAIDLSQTEAQFSEPENEQTSDEVSLSEDKSQVTPTNTQQKVKSQEPVAKETAPKHQAEAISGPAYTLQLGSFKNAANVNGLVKRLRDNGFRAYTLPNKPVDGSLTKVFVGPDVSMSKLQKLQKKVDQLTGLKSAVVSYNPVE